MKLNEAKTNSNLRLIKIEGGSGVEFRLSDLGLLPGEKMQVVQNNGTGPVTLLVKGSKISLGNSLATKIFVKEIIMKNKNKITVALAGNPNCGKSTIFNNLTGSRQHIGNYPGVTVEKKTGITQHKEYEIEFIDLPGTYSLSAHSEDEKVTRDFLVKEKPDIVIHVVDASNLERNLYLYTQLNELNIPIILAMNMIDMVKSKGHHIDFNELSLLFGKPIIPTIGNKRKGMENILNSIIKVQKNLINTKSNQINYGEEIEEELKKLTSLLNKNKSSLEVPNKWISIKLLENDDEANKIIKSLQDFNLQESIFKQVRLSKDHLSKHFNEDTDVLIADRRYGFISGACTQAVRFSIEDRHDISDTIDKVILNRFLGLPIFALVMFLIFKFTFTFSEPVVGWFEKIFNFLSEKVTTLIPEGLTQSFLVDGIIGGVGGVIGFFPLVLFMFFAIAFFEDTGYMARAAFVMDKIMHKFGLHGKSFLPMMISTNGCAVPGIMASRTLDSKKDRLITMMVTPFMICGAKLPIFALFIGAFFSTEQAPNVMFIMYALSVVIAFTCAWLLKKFVFKGEAAHFVMELPPYRVPTLGGLLLKMWERGWQYIKKAGSIILFISIIIWAAFTFPTHEDKNSAHSEEVLASLQIENSYAGRLGKTIEPLVKPIGLDWKSGVAFIAGIAAKEVVVSTLGTIYSLGDVDPEKSESLKNSLRNDTSWNILNALAFLMFSLIYMPCFVAMAVFYRESGSSIKWTSFLIFWTSILAWISAFIVYQGGRLLGV